MKTKNILQIVMGTDQTDGAGVKLVRVLGPRQTRDFDPFLMLDAFDSRTPDDYVKGFPWHPHRGIETVSYLISGEIEHGDSLGNRGHIVDGGCQWMTAGSGIIHQEMPQPSPRMLGLQLWINLPRKNKWVRPEYRNITADQIPEVQGDSGVIRVISGTCENTPGPTQGDYVKTLLLDVILNPHASWRLPVDDRSTLFIYILDGAGLLGEPPQRVERHRAVLMGDGDTFVVNAGPDGMRFVLFAGRPLREPIAWGGPIVMNTDRELDQAFAEMENGTFIRADGPRGTP